jgi:hypothetical protein
MDEEVGLEDLAAATMESTVFWVVGYMFRRNISSLSSGSKSKPRKKPAEAELSLQPNSANYLHGLLFYPEDGGDMFLRNVGHLPNYTPLQPTRGSSESQEVQRKGNIPHPCRLSVRHTASVDADTLLLAGSHRAVLARPVPPLSAGHYT